MQISYFCYCKTVLIFGASSIQVGLIFSHLTYSYLDRYYKFACLMLSIFKAIIKTEQQNYLFESKADNFARLRIKYQSLPSS